MSGQRPDASRAGVLAACALAAALLAGCGDKAGAPPGGAPEVTVYTVQPAAIVSATELPGRVEALRTAQVRARVPGIVLKRVFAEGSEVAEGEVLYRIDPAPLQAAANSAKAALARAEALAATARQKAARYKPLVETNAVSKQEFDDAVAQAAQTEADVAAAKAALDKAQLDLGYATVTAPIPGRIGRALVTEGALVGQGEATQLALIQQLDSVYVNFVQSATDLARLKRAMSQGKLKSLSNEQMGVGLVMEDGTPYPLQGKLLFSDISVDPGTGSITLRAQFPNPKRDLLPGMYARVKLNLGVDEKALAVPQQAVSRNALGASVFVVGADGKVSVRPVKADAAYGDKWIISDGLAAGERVIVEGLQKVKPGAQVKANEAAPKPAAAPSAAAPSAPAAAGAAGAPAAAPADKK
ncbi:MAG: efflux RND transporter periplasmic adaptor subunit [Candidatus Protistobacter heckmanni]|nr:efflux RND transporter periplasmic adaptor subunit [Candidatus Protistobacter heckmanni]